MKSKCKKQKIQLFNLHIIKHHVHILNALLNSSISIYYYVYELYQYQKVNLSKIALLKKMHKFIYYKEIKKRKKGGNLF